jgi:hypothetical protein
MSNPTAKTKVSKQNSIGRTPDIEQQKLLRLFKMIWLMNQKGYININFGEDELQCISDALNHALPERDIARGIQAKLFQYLSFGLKSQSAVIRNKSLKN